MRERDNGCCYKPLYSSVEDAQISVADPDPDLDHALAPNQQVFIEGSGTNVAILNSIAYIY